MLRLRWAVQADYFARRVATDDLTGIDGPAENEKGLEDARRGAQSTGSGSLSPGPARPPDGGPSPARAGRRPRCRARPGAPGGGRTAARHRAAGSARRRSPRSCERRPRRSPGRPVRGQRRFVGQGADQTRGVGAGVTGEADEQVHVGDVGLVVEPGPIDRPVGSDRRRPSSDASGRRSPGTRGRAAARALAVVDVVELFSRAATGRCRVAVSPAERERSEARPDPLRARPISHSTAR